MIHFADRKVTTIKTIKTLKGPVTWGDAAALVRSHMNGLIPFERTTERTKETIPLASEQ